MDRSSGEIYPMPNDEEAERIKKKLNDRFMEMELPPTKNQKRRKPPRVYRFEPCPCGSGKRFENCCMMEDKHGGGE